MIRQTNADLLMAGELVRRANESTLRLIVYLGTTVGAEDLANSQLSSRDITVDYDVGGIPDGPTGLAAQSSATVKVLTDFLAALAAYGRRDYV